MQRVACVTYVQSLTRMSLLARVSGREGVHCKLAFLSRRLRTAEKQEVSAVVRSASPRRGCSADVTCTSCMNGGSTRAKKTDVTSFSSAIPRHESRSKKVAWLVKRNDFAKWMHTPGLCTAAKVQILMACCARTIFAGRKLGAKRGATFFDRRASHATFLRTQAR